MPGSEVGIGFNAWLYLAMLSQLDVHFYGFS